MRLERVRQCLARRVDYAPDAALFEAHDQIPIDPRRSSGRHASAQTDDAASRNGVEPPFEFSKMRASNTRARQIQPAAPAARALVDRDVHACRIVDADSDERHRFLAQLFLKQIARQSARKHHCHRRAAQARYHAARIHALAARIERIEGAAVLAAEFEPVERHRLVESGIERNRRYLRHGCKLMSVTRVMKPYNLRPPLMTGS